MNRQLQGLRAVAVLSVMAFHLVPKRWQLNFPLENGLFYFFVLSGFFSTRSLLRAGSSRWEAARRFWKRRAARLVVPSTVCVAFGALVGAPDILNHPWSYLLFGSNVLIAAREAWPSGTSHWWTLAVQVQVYALWPLGLLVPRRFLGHLLLSVFVLGVVSRSAMPVLLPGFPHAELMLPSTLDYFAVGGLLAWIREDGRWMAALTVPRVALVAYVCLTIFERTYGVSEIWARIQSVLLALAVVALLDRTLDGRMGWVGRLLEHPLAQHLGSLGLGLYLLHNLAPLALGSVAPWLWEDGHLVMRGAAFLFTSWFLAWLLALGVESPLQRWIARPAP